jgi:hypothetical protein
MGQQVSTTIDRNSQIQTSIESFIQNVLEDNHKCGNLDDDMVVEYIQGQIKTILKKTPHNQLSIFQKQIHPERLSKNIHMEDLIEYYTNKVIAIASVYNTRELLVDELNKILDNEPSKMNKIVTKIHELDEMAKILVEEVIHTTYIADGRVRKRKYYRERPVSSKQLDKIILKLDSFENNL